MQEYIKTDRQIHWLSQVVAKANKSFVPEEKDDSHTNIYFDPLGNKIYGRWIKSPKGLIMLSLNLDGWQFEWLDKSLHVFHKTSIFEKTMNQLEKGVSEFPASMHMETKGLFEALHFEIPNYGFEKIAQKEIADQGLKSWKYFRSLANTACGIMLGYLQGESEIRIWPHHFDTGIFTQMSEDLGLGFGLAMEDTMVGEPYFYLSGYNSVHPINYENVIALSSGEWITNQQWKGAVLPLGAIQNVSGEESVITLQNFVKESTDWFLQQ